MLRERSWREGPWEALAGRGAPSHIDLGGPAQEERLALDRLPLRAPPLTEALDLPCAPASPPAPAAPPIWARRLRAELLSGGGPCGCGPVVVAEGGEVQRLELQKGGALWRRKVGLP